MRDRSYGMTIRRVEDGKSKYSGSGTKGNRFVPQVIYLNLNYTVYTATVDLVLSISYPPFFTCTRSDDLVEFAAVAAISTERPSSRKMGKQQPAFIPANDSIVRTPLLRICGNFMTDQCQRHHRTCRTFTELPARQNGS